MMLYGEDVELDEEGQPYLDKWSKLCGCYHGKKWESLLSRPRAVKAESYRESCEGEWSFMCCFRGSGELFLRKNE